MKSIIIKKATFSGQKFFIKENKLVFIFLLIIFSGIALGSVLIHFVGETAKSEIFELLNDYLSEGKSLSIIKLFSRSLVNDYLYLFILFVSGGCAFGLPVIFLLPFFKGMSTGVIISYLYLTQGLNGFVHFVIVMALPLSLMLICIVFACKEGFYMAINISSYIFWDGKRQGENTYSFFTYMKRYVILSFSVIVISFIDAIITHIFSGII